MKTLIDQLQRKQQLERLQKLNLETVPLWGKLTASNLLPHLTDPFRIALGEFEAKPAKSFLSTSTGKFIAIYMMPRWPNGAPAHPKTDIQKEGRKGCDFDHDLKELVNIIKPLYYNVSEDDFL